MTIGIVTGLEAGLLPVQWVYGGGLYFGAERTERAEWAERALLACQKWAREPSETMNSPAAPFSFPDASGGAPQRRRAPSRSVHARRVAPARRPRNIRRLHCTTPPLARVG
ncbi:hypothetical protein [Streptomyces chrestomyceticus]|uniref:hypothetical protein n=1 Tax=Streptomyces chrestomyceticus TaxID=68185 RepID=UPI0033DD4B57